MALGFKLFRKNKDQQELDNLRGALDVLDLAGEQKSYDSLKPLQNTFWADDWLFSLGFAKEQARTKRRRYRKLMASLFVQERAIYRDVRFLEEFNPAAAESLWQGYSLDLSSIKHKQKCVAQALEYLDSFLSTDNTKFWDLFENLENKLFTLLKFDEAAILAQELSELEGAQFQAYIDKAIKRVSHYVVHYVSKIGLYLKRDIRQSFRNLVRLLFKNMDDNSGESDNSVVFNPIIFSNFNYYTHVRRHHKAYRFTASGRRYF